MKTSFFYILTLLSLLSTVGFASVNQKTSYIAVVDAGSTSSRILIFKTEPNLKGIPKITLMPNWVFRLENDQLGGIQNAIKNPTQLSQYIDPLAQFAKSQLKEHIKETPILFLATGGMRQLTGPEQTNLIKAIEKQFQTFGFKEVYAEVISGLKEGIFAWLTINYLLGTLETGSMYETFGILDMGGASTQVTFIPFEKPKQHLVNLSLGAKEYPVYSISYPDFGNQIFQNNTKIPSCYLKDTEKDKTVAPYIPVKNPAGNYKVCKQQIAQHFKKLCGETKPCIRGEQQETPKMPKNILAIGAYAFLLQSLGLPHFSTQALDQAGEQICKMTWGAFTKKYQDRRQIQYLAGSCFELAYYSVLLSGDGTLLGNYGLGVSKNQTISFPLRIGDQDVFTWALGAALFYEMRGSI